MYGRVAWHYNRILDERAQDADESARYAFTRNGDNTVSFSGQSARMICAEEIMAKMGDVSDDGSTLAAMFDGTGTFAHPLAEALKGSKKLSDSVGYSIKDADEKQAVADRLKNMLEARSSMDLSVTASKGTAGVLGDPDKRRVILNAEGYELNQVFMKSVIGALCADQIVNKYLGDAKMGVKDSDIMKKNSTKQIEEYGKTYTEMEHNFDEAWGYMYGRAHDAAALSLAQPTGGKEDAMLYKYLISIDGGAQPGIAKKLLAAYIKGRTAIVANDYAARDEAREEIKGLVKRIVLLRAIYYIESAMKKLVDDKAPAADPDAMAAFSHSLSEGVGFLYSLRFTHDVKLDVDDVSAWDMTRAILQGHRDELAKLE